MSTTPVRTALPTSKAGIALGPPMKLSCRLPLPSALSFCMKPCRFFTYCEFSTKALTTRSVVSWACASIGHTANAAASQTVVLMGLLLVEPRSVGAGYSFVKSMQCMLSITAMNVGDVDLNLLRVFDAVLRERGVTPAAG